MHIPDGFLTSATWVPAWLLSWGASVTVLKKSVADLRERIIPLMGVMSAFIFAAQDGQFSGHERHIGTSAGRLLAAVSARTLCGAIVLTCVLIVQCLIFQDGGLTRWAPTFSHVDSRHHGRLWGSIKSSAATPATGRRSGGYGGCFLVFRRGASSCCAIQLALSDLSPLTVVLSGNGRCQHIGVGEAMITDGGYRIRS